MSHDDIRAALVRDQQRGGRFPADPELQHKAADWLAELLAEVDEARRELGDVHVSLYSEIAMLTARAEAAEQTVRRVRAQCDSWSHGNSWNKAARNAILRALDGGER